MKEMKFRAWDKKKKEWCKDSVYIGQDGWHFCLKLDDHNPDLIILLYTGLKDIWENDIVECPDGWMGEVWWNEEELQWWAKDHDLAGLNNPKVIGNIYENGVLNV